MDILNGRPEGMDFKEYKAKLKLQKILIKHKKKGKLVWLSKLHNSKEVVEQLAEAKMIDTLGKLLYKGQTFIGNTKKLTGQHV